MDTLIIRPAAPQDLSQIMEIERVSFASPWECATIDAALANPHTTSLVAEVGAVVTGYCFASELKDMIHILNLAVRPQWRRKAIARRLMQEIITYSVALGKTGIFLEVRTGNHAAMALYRSLEFHDVCTWHNYYADTGENAHIMLRTCGPGERA